MEIKFRESAPSCSSDTASSGARPRLCLAAALWNAAALLAVVGLVVGCGSSSDPDRPETSVLKTRSGETTIQVTESEQDGVQVVRVTTTYRGQESTIVMAVDHAVYEVDIPLTIAQQAPAMAMAGAPAAGRNFQDLLLAQYLEKSQAAMLDGIYNEALRQVNLVLLVRPDHVVARQMKGSIYYAMGNFELANQEWEQVLALDPSNQEVRDFIDFLKNRQGAPQPPLPGGAPGGGPAPPSAPRSNPPGGGTGATQ